MEYPGFPRSREGIVQEQQGGEATEICAAIVWMGHLIERFTNTRLPQAGVAPGMSVSRANALFAIAAAERNGTSTRMVDIALDLGVTARTITPLVDALEKQGLVVRVPDERDRRAIQLELTDAGRAQLAPLAQAVEGASDILLGPLSSAERRTLLDLLTRLIERDTGE